jgi:hypothetical protein
MKLFYFLIPIALWGLMYFTLPLGVPSNPNGMWWVVTNIFMAFGILGTLLLALFKNHPDL